jgi:chorismate dehydratase
LDKIKVSAVSYTNSKPFVHGLIHSGIPERVDFSLDIPAVCAQKLIDNQIDIGLVPVAALLEVPDYQIISNYCIGATGPVDSVFIFSDKSIEEVRTVKLDVQSRTSNNLCKVLLKNHWKTAPQFVDGDADAFVLIGDRTFGKKDEFAFHYDLSEEWLHFTGLPFVFAVWASNKSIPLTFTEEFNAALKYGLDHRAEVIKAIPPQHNFDFDDYLMNKLDYDLDNRKRQALRKFHDLIRAL